MNPHGDGKKEPTDPEQVLRLLEIELAQQRAIRQRGRSPYRGFRLASFVFLFAVIAGTILAMYYVFFSGGLNEFRSKAEAEPSATTSPHAP
jgi:hypothetical protein